MNDITTGTSNRRAEFDTMINDTVMVKTTVDFEVDVDTFQPYYVHIMRLCTTQDGVNWTTLPGEIVTRLPIELAQDFQAVSAADILDAVANSMKTAFKGIASTHSNA